MDVDTRAERQLPSLQAALRHHWSIVLIAVVLGVGAGTVYAANLERSYTASAIVMLNPVVANPLAPEAASGSGAQLTVALETEAEVVTTPAIAEGVSERLGRLVPDEGEFLEVEVPTGTQMVRIALTTDSAEAAGEGAQAFAEVYLDYREEQALNSVESSLTTFRTEADEIEEELRAALTAAESDAYAAREVDLFVDRLAIVNTQISTLESTMTDPGHVLQPAREPSGSNEMGDVMIQGAAGVLALGLGLLIAWYREWRSGLVDEATAADVAGVPIFTTVPTTNQRRTAVGDDAVHEAYRHLRAGVVANVLRPYSLAVRAIGGRRDAPMVASNLALVLTEAGYSVLLVAADPEDRTVEAVAEVGEGSPGLADVLSGDVDIQDVLVQYRGMTVLPGGREPGSVRELYAGPQFRQVLKGLRGCYDFMVLSTAGDESADGDAVCAAADAVLLVLTVRTSSHLQVSAALERFERLGVRTMGAVTVASGRSATVVARAGGSTTRNRGSRVKT